MINNEMIARACIAEVVSFEGLKVEYFKNTASFTFKIGEKIQVELMARNSAEEFKAEEPNYKMWVKVDGVTVISFTAVTSQQVREHLSSLKYWNMQANK